MQSRLRPDREGLERHRHIRGDTILWFYTSYDGELRRHLIVAALDDPDGAATRYLDLGWRMVGDGHSCSRRDHDLCNIVFPVDGRFTY